MSKPEAEAYVGAWKLCDVTLKSKQKTLDACVNLTVSLEDQAINQTKTIEQYKNEEKSILKNPWVYLVVGLVAGFFVAKH